MNYVTQNIPLQQGLRPPFSWEITINIFRYSIIPLQQGFNWKNIWWCRNKYLSLQPEPIKQQIMARKVFVSFLGTSFYGTCCYKRGDFCSESTRFIQDAMLQCHHVEEWTENDMIIMLLTNSAKEQNWKVENNQRSKYPGQSMEDYKGLKDILEERNYEAEVVAVDLEPDYKNRKEEYEKETDEDRLWRIFNIVYSQLKPNDEIFFDVTHAYRYLPMFSVVLGNYTKFMKKAKITSISYGNYEARTKVDGKFVAPIVDLLPLSELQDWTFAAANFLRSGDASKLVELNGGLENIKAVVEDMIQCRGYELFKADHIKTARRQIDNLENNQHTHAALRDVLEEIRQSLSSFAIKSDNKLDRAKNIIRAAIWCYGKRHYQAAITLLKEGIVTYVCIEGSGEDLKLQLTDYSERLVVEEAFIKRSYEIDGKSYCYGECPKKYNERSVRMSWKEAIDAISKVLEDYEQKDFVKKYLELKDYRNSINHAGNNQENFAGNVKMYIDYFAPYFQLSALWQSTLAQM